MRCTNRVVLAILMLAIPVASLRAVPLDCTPGMAAAPMACSGPSCCCKDLGACLCPRPAAPAAPAAPPAPALISSGIDSHCDAQVAAGLFEFSSVTFTSQRVRHAFAAACVPSSEHHLCVLQV